MTILLDTHVLLWFFWNDPQLSVNAKSLITDPANQKLVSIASCWEISIKLAIGKLTLGESAAVFLPREIAKNNFQLLPISIEHATAVETLPLLHSDPFDRLLVAQAMIENAPLVSIDAAFDQYPITRLWK